MSFPAVNIRPQTNSSANSGVFGFGSAGDLNIMQAAAIDVGRDDATRQRIEQVKEMYRFGLFAGLATPFLVQGATSSAGLWLFNNLVTNQGALTKFNLVGGTADLAYQLGTRDIRNVNPVSTGAALLFAPLPTAFLGYSLNLSYNGVQKNEWKKNPLSFVGLSNISISTLSFYGLGKAGEWLGVPYIKIGGLNMPNIFGPALGIGANTAGNAAAEKGSEAAKSKSEENK